MHADGTLGAETTVGGLIGGTGGNQQVLSCPANFVVSAADIAHGTWVDGVRLICQPWLPSSRTFHGAGANTTVAGRLLAGTSPFEERCGEPSQPGHAIRGRSASLVDALGLICDEP